MTDATRLLDAIAGGDAQASDQLLPLVYEELRRLAAARLAHEKPGQTLNATALVHEAYLRLVGPDNRPRWEGRAHFFAAAAEAMRRILIDQARKRASMKHGAGCSRIDLDQANPLSPVSSDPVLALDEALTRFAEVDPVAADLVKLRYFVGLSIPQAAEALGIAPRSADRLWAYARAWLRLELGEFDP